MSLYPLLSLIKTGVGLAIIISIYYLINPYSDLLIAVSGSLLGIFLMTRGASFFVFLGWRRYIDHQVINDDIITHSYKLSLLFGLYSIFNIIFLLKGVWSVLLGLLILGGFIAIQWWILPPVSRPDKKSD